MQFSDIHWKSLRYFSIYRLCIAALLFAMPDVNNKAAEDIQLRFGDDVAQLVEQIRRIRELVGVLAHPDVREWYEAALAETEAHAHYDALAAEYGGPR